MANRKLYQYRITGYYYTGYAGSLEKDEYKRFEEIVWAENNTVAMEMVIGKNAWAESLNGRTFQLDVIHYDCW